jgi:hypothetical protein
MRFLCCASIQTALCLSTVVINRAQQQRSITCSASRTRYAWSPICLFFYELLYHEVGHLILFIFFSGVSGLGATVKVDRLSHQHRPGKKSCLTVEALRRNIADGSVKEITLKIHHTEVKPFQKASLQSSTHVYTTSTGNTHVYTTSTGKLCQTPTGTTGTTCVHH